MSCVLALRNGVVLVEPFGMVRARLADADGLDSVMAAGWEAFEVILFAAHEYGGLKSGGFATWMWAVGPASDGSAALEPGPPRREAGLGIDSGDLAGVGEDDAFRALAVLAEQLHGKLRAAALDASPERVHDAEACGRAAEAASELHGLFALDE